jgi:hypothetical protein
VIAEDKPQIPPAERFEKSSSAKVERAASMWDLFHPKEDLRGQGPLNPFKYRRPLPEIKRTEDYGQVWQTAPFANDYQFDHSFQPPPVIKQVNID